MIKMFIIVFKHLNPVDHHPERIRKIDKDFARKLDSKGLKFPVKIRDIHKIEKKVYQLQCLWLSE